MCLPSTVLPPLTPCSVSVPPLITGPRVRNGIDASIEHFPFQASIFNHVLNQHKCGATILSQFVLLTAAHCFSTNNPAPWSVVVGSSNLSSMGGTEQRIRVAKILIHEDYGKKEGSPEDDISLVFLSSPLQFNKSVKSIAIPTIPICYAGVGTVSGWGRVTKYDDSSGPDLLQSADIPLLSTDECKKKITDFNATGFEVSDKFICAYKDDTDACPGDSGGPLSGYVDGSQIIIGVVSWGTLNVCGNNRGFPGLYTNVSMYASWIRARIKEVPRVVVEEVFGDAGTIEFDGQKDSHLTRKIWIIPQRGDQYVRSVSFVLEDKSLGSNAHLSLWNVGGDKHVYNGSQTDWAKQVKFSNAALLVVTLTVGNSKSTAQPASFKLKFTLTRKETFYLNSMQAMVRNGLQSVSYPPHNNQTYPLKSSFMAVVAPTNGNPFELSLKFLDVPGTMPDCSSTNFRIRTVLEDGTMTGLKHSLYYRVCGRSGDVSLFFGRVIFAVITFFPWRNATEVGRGFRFEINNST